MSDWLRGLTPEQRLRFGELREAFKREQEDRHHKQVESDIVDEAAAEEHRLSMRPREDFMSRQRAREFADRREQRRRAGIDATEDPEGRSEAEINDGETVEEIENGHRDCSEGELGRDFQFRDK